MKTGHNLSCAFTNDAPAFGTIRNPSNTLSGFHISRIIFLSMTFLLLCGTQKTFADDCGSLHEGSTRWGGCLLHQDTQELEYQLNEKYKTILKGYKETGSVQERKMLIEAERAWVAFRDKTCEFENQAIGGINSISWARCYYRLTKERLEYFENDINGLPLFP